jgi:hypothetical protein
MDIGDDEFSSEISLAECCADRSWNDELCNDQSCIRSGETHADIDGFGSWI